MSLDYGYSQSNCPVDFTKDPDATLDIPFHWAKELDGDTIDTSTVILPDGLTSVSDTDNGSTRTIRISGGNSCSSYRVTNRIVTGDSRTFDKTYRVAVKER